MKHYDLPETPEENYQQQKKILSGGKSSKPDFECCPFCGSTDVGSVTLLGTVHISCYRCDAEVKFTTVGLHVNDQIRRYNKRTN